MVQVVDPSHLPFDPSIESTVNVTVSADVNEAPNASFSWSADGLTVMFSNASTDSDGDVLTYLSLIHL